MFVVKIRALLILSFNCIGKHQMTKSPKDPKKKNRSNRKVKQRVEVIEKQKKKSKEEKGSNRKETFLKEKEP